MIEELKSFKIGAFLLLCWSNRDECVFPFAEMDNTVDQRKEGIIFSPLYILCRVPFGSPLTH